MYWKIICKTFDDMKKGEFHVSRTPKDIKSMIDSMEHSKSCNGFIRVEQVLEDKDFVDNTYSDGSA